MLACDKSVAQTFLIWEIKVIRNEHTAHLFRSDRALEGRNFIAMHIFLAVDVVLMRSVQTNFFIGSQRALCYKNGC